MPLNEINTDTKKLQLDASKRDVQGCGPGIFPTYYNLIPNCFDKKNKVFSIGKQMFDCDRHNQPTNSL